MTNKKTFITVAVIAVFILSTWGVTAIFFSKTSTKLTATVKKGKFEVAVLTTGELEAKNSVKIYGPTNLGQASIWNIKISDIVAEGTAVKKGDYVAQLDRKGISENLNGLQYELQSSLRKIEEAKIDTTIDLQNERNRMESLASSILDKKTEIETSIYEPPLIIKKLQKGLEKEEKELKQAEEQYKLIKVKAETKILNAQSSYHRITGDINLLNQIMEELTISAPQDGIVIYRKDFQGEKFGKGSTVNPWDPVIAELPDLGVLISKTFVNEVDIRSVKLGQLVLVSFDAFPHLKMEGKVIKIANIGETARGGTAKIFGVDILLNDTHPEIKPGMTSSNKIIIHESSNSYFLPIESVFNQSDSLDYVFLKDGFKSVKKEVLLGKRNDLNVEIKTGLEEGNEVLLLPPENSQSMPFIRLKDSKPVSPINH